MELETEQNTPQPPASTVLPKQDPRTTALVHVIVHQGDFIVLLVAALIVSLYITISDIKLPNQTALAVPPPFEPTSIQLAQYIFQDRQNFESGAETTKPDIEVLGQILDFNKVKTNWPGYELIINGTKVVPEDSIGSYHLNLTLKPGSNIIESKVSINGNDYGKQETIINYVTGTTSTEDAGQTEAP